MSGVISSFQYQKDETRMTTRLIGIATAPACSSTHVPGYIASPKLKDAGKVFVVSVNDAFVYATLLHSIVHNGITP